MYVPLQRDCTQTERPETKKKKQNLLILHKLSHSPGNLLPPETKLPVSMKLLLGLPPGTALSSLTKPDGCTKVKITDLALAQRLIGFRVSLTGRPPKNWKQQYLLRPIRSPWDSETLEQALNINTYLTVGFCKAKR